MKKQTKNFLIIKVIVIFVVGMWLGSIKVVAWSDNSENGRPSYTKAEINQLQEDGKWGNKIVFNSISDSVIGDEKNFVGARQCIQRADGSWEGTTEDTVWNANEIMVEDGKFYIVRLYVHNNNPNGYNGVAKDVKVAFNVPINSDDENKIEISGHISSSNATPTEYEDDIVFISKTERFHLEYIYGSAYLENQGSANGPLDDEIVNAKTGGVLIGYDELNGEMPGCYQYDCFVTIQVRVVFDYDFTVEQQVRKVGDTDQTWKKSVEAKVGDKVEFRIQYKNTSNFKQENVAIKDTLPDNLCYISGSTYIKNANHPNYDRINEDYLIDPGIKIGKYSKGANAYIKFTAEVVDNNLGYGHNVLINWAQAGVGDTTRRAGASVTLTKKYVLLEIAITIFGIMIVICFISICILIYRMIRLKKLKNSGNR